MLSAAAMRILHHSRPYPHLQLLRRTTLNPKRMCLLLAPHVRSYFQLILVNLEQRT
jgi:hypothetical protein